MHSVINQKLVIEEQGPLELTMDDCRLSISSIGIHQSKNSQSSGALELATDDSRLVQSAIVNRKSIIQRGPGIDDGRLPMVD
jgi:hypothetical protein